MEFTADNWARSLLRRDGHACDRQPQDDKGDRELEQRFLDTTPGTNEGPALQASHAFALYLKKDYRD